jgi:hypothetical protein
MNVVIFEEGSIERKSAFGLSSRVRLKGSVRNEQTLRA